MKVKIDGFVDILKRIFRLALRPATLQRRNMRDEVAILSWLNDDLDVHGIEISTERNF